MPQLPNYLHPALYRCVLYQIAKTAIQIPFYATSSVYCLNNGMKGIIWDQSILKFSPTLHHGTKDPSLQHPTLLMTADSGDENVKERVPDEGCLQREGDERSFSRPMVMKIYFGSYNSRGFSPFKSRTLDCGRGFVDTRLTSEVFQVKDCVVL